MSSQFLWCSSEIEKAYFKAMSMTENESFDKHLEELLQTVKAARANFDIWWVYKNDQDRNKYVETLNNYLMFFRVSIHAHWVAMLMALYKLYDLRKDSIGIQDLISEAKQTPNFPQDIYESIAVNLRLALPLWEKVRVLRHKLFAHRDKNLNYDEIFKSANITADTLRSLTEHSLDILNLISYWRHKDTYRFSDCHSEDTYKLLNALQKWQNLA
jgi:hypothetical protein